MIKQTWPLEVPCHLRKNTVFWSYTLQPISKTQLYNNVKYFLSPEFYNVQLKLGEESQSGGKKPIHSQSSLAKA